MFFSYFIVLSFSDSTSFSYAFWPSFRSSSFFGSPSSSSCRFFYTKFLTLFCVTLRTRSMVSGVHVMICSISFLLTWKFNFLSTFSTLMQSYCWGCSSWPVWWLPRWTLCSYVVPLIWGNNGWWSRPEALHLRNLWWYSSWDATGESGRPSCTLRSVILRLEGVRPFKFVKLLIICITHALCSKWTVSLWYWDLLEKALYLFPSAQQFLLALFLFFEFALGLLEFGS